MVGFFVFMIIGQMKKPCKECPFTKGHPAEEFADVLGDPEFPCHETLGLDDELECAGRLELRALIGVINE